MIESVCTVAGSQITSKAVFGGDFEKSYRGDVHASYNPPLGGMSNSDMTFTATYLGACKSGQSPGDIIMSNGMKMNILQMAKTAEAAARSPKM